MPNWCNTTYKCVGDKKEIKEFLKILRNNDRRKTNRVPNGFGTMWLGCIIDNFGLDWKNYQCRGEITDFLYLDNTLIIYQSTAWCEQEGFRQAIKERFPSIEVYFMEEEPGMCIYCTNSFDMFPQRYIIDMCLSGVTNYDYFESIKEVSEYLSDVFNTPIGDTVDEVKKFCNDFSNKHEDSEEYINFIEIELIQ